MKEPHESNIRYPSWEPMVFAERHTRHPDYAAMVKIKNAIRYSRIHGFICESFATIEAIRTKDRAAYAANKIPIVKTQAATTGPGSIAMSINIESNHSLHPGLPPIQEAKLTEALAIGMRLLTAPYFNQPLPDLLLNNPAFYAPEVFATDDYNERFGAAVSAIQSRGVGNAVLPALLNRIVERLGANRPNVRWEIQLLQHAYRNAEDNAEKGRLKRHSLNVLMATPLPLISLLEARSSALKI